ncbi:MAG: hypothetical protein WBG91_01970 [Syntrophobacteria bacterium]
MILPFNPARIFHESPAATTGMAVLPGVLGCSFDPFDELRAGKLRTGSPCDVPLRYASEPIPRSRGTVTRWHAHLLRARCAPLSPASGFPVSRSRDSNT